MSGLRRSTRAGSKSKEEQDNGTRSDDSVTEHIKEDQRATLAVTYEDDIFDSDSSSEEDNDADDDDYVDPSVSRKRKGTSQRKGGRKRKSPAKTGKKSAMSNNTSGRAHVSGSKKDQEKYLEIIKDFEPIELFNALSVSEDVSIDELLRDWLDTYQEDRDQFLAEFINLLLNCCGAVAKVEKHDVHSNDSSNETIGEIQLLFQRQKLHEFHLLISKTNKKTASYRPLYQNFVEFMSKLLEIADDLQLLYVETGNNVKENSDNEDEVNSEITMSPLILDLLTWLSSFSVSKIRCFRYVSTLTLYLFQDFLSEHIVNLDKNYLSKFTRQLNLEKKKKRPNKKTIAQFENNILEIQSNRAVIENIVDNIIKLCFIHRFKDVDESIRSESMLHLSIWIDNDPEYFMKVTFLKYFGWLLSDSSSTVRLQVLKILPDVIKKSKTESATDNSAIRQFFERFKQRILEISLKDVDLEVRLNAVNILVEISSLGYLDNAEILVISSLIFANDEIKVTSHSKNSRFLSSAAKFLARVVNEQCNDFIRNNEVDENLSKIETSSIIKIGTFIRFLSNSLLYYLQDKNEEEITPRMKIHILFQAAEFLYPYFGSQIENISLLLTDDNEFTNVFNMLSQISKENEQTMELDEEVFDTSLLLPTDDNNTIFYVTVLNGLCHGGISIKAQIVSQSVIPYLGKLLNNLPIQSSDVLSPILEIFNLFSYDDWIQVGHEKEIYSINHILAKVFMETGIDVENNYTEDIKVLTLTQTLTHLKNFKLKDIDELWINQITLLKMQFEKFLDENVMNDDEDAIEKYYNTAYSFYINKLVLLGKEYSIEFGSELLVAFLKKFIFTISRNFEMMKSESINIMNFKLPVILVTWQLQKWKNIFSTTTNSGISENNLKSFENTLKYVSVILDQLNKLLIELCDKESNVKFIDLCHLKWLLSTSVIDIAVSMRYFELQIPQENGVAWKDSMTEKFPYYLHDKSVEVLLQVFLYLESLVASKNDAITLDKFAEEDVNLNDLSNDNFFEDNEKQLLLYTIKLKGLIRLGIITNAAFVNRMSLNKDKLGDLYEKIVDDTIFEDHDANKKKEKPIHQDKLEQSPEPIDTIDINEERPISKATQDSVEPMEDSSQISSQDSNVQPLSSTQGPKGLEPIQETSQEVKETPSEVFSSMEVGPIENDSEI
ncbi:hypothetical protein KAFR_0L00660 [Kazachstania africana CBS 2517]|uniref:SCD domain-containing protein n=1 Tax=Kazachstania africana (strain ATCC 22294 / BCRC 22015 / CBS 2517 / CECT 1963 / NBRC 1671 / NRRL Y-8276) TaxID=1071382 RepID=H2B223_KAZAF|nr:hypothetical protein KAFR_0L00660 [Kazachstania africana CBS 2517]CCF60673.1 hypothetical protein KAFR_0L00660 [Kazachstania africana CBS 2517]